MEHFAKTVRVIEVGGAWRDVGHDACAAMCSNALRERRHTQCAAGGVLQMIAENRFSNVVAAQTLRFFEDHLVAQQTMSTGMAAGCYRG